MTIGSVTSAAFTGFAALRVALSTGLEAQDADPKTPPVSGDDVDPRCRSDVHRASDYALGRRVGTVKVPGTDGGMEIDGSVRTEAHLELAAGGCAIIERRIVHREGRREPSRVLTVRAYDPDEGRWDQLLVGNGPVVLRFRGESSQQGLRFATVPPQGEAMVRVTDRPVEPAGFDRVIGSSGDSGRR